MTRLLLAGGRIIDPASGLDRSGDVLVGDGRITAVGDVFTPREVDRRIDCAGRLIVPGLIDVHVHLREPPLADPPVDDLAETIATGAAAAAAGGFATVCAMPNTQPPIDSPDAVRCYLERGREAGKARVLPVGALTRGRGGSESADLEAMRDAGAVAFSDDGSDVADAGVFGEVCAEAARIGAVVICHCEDPHLAAGGVVNDGPVATALGLPGQPVEAEIAAVERACEMARLHGCRIHVAHVSTAAAAGAIRRAKADGLPVTAEATPHHLTLTDESLLGRDPVFKVNPPLRSAGDVAGVVDGVLDGTIDCLACDHAPHSAKAKGRGLAEAPFGMIGLESALAVYAGALVETGRLGWPELVARMTFFPARALGLEAGTLAVGAQADVAVIDPEAAWTVDPDRFASQARNCPFAGREVCGRAVLTVVGGRVVFDSGA
jgi:dihydroorotase